jgi:hypothetical protein
MMLPLPRETVRAITPEPSTGDPVTMKLDAIMSILQNFETTVNHRLSGMEQLLLDNSERITRLEDQFRRRQSLTKSHDDPIGAEC